MMSRQLQMIKVGLVVASFFLALLVPAGSVEATGKINDRISAESFMPNEGSFLVGDLGIEVFNSPDDSTPVIAFYDPGEQIRYDKITYYGDWISYRASNGKRRYVEVRELRQNGPIDYGVTVSHHGVTARKGTFAPNQVISIRNTPDISAPPISGPGPNYYESGDKVTFDQLLLSDGHHWLSYISSSGHRRYLPIGKLTEKNLWGKVTVAK